MYLIMYPLVDYLQKPFHWHCSSFKVPDLLLVLLNWKLFIFSVWKASLPSP